MQRLPAKHVIALSATLLLAACTHHEKPPQEPPPSADKFQVNVRWIPNPSVDLMSPEGTFIRATTESWHEVWSAYGRGMDAIRERGYPGFEHAYNHAYDKAGSTPSDFWTNQIGDAPRNSDGLAVGTSYSEVVSLRRDGDRFIADVCTYTSQTAGKLKDGKFESRSSPDFGSADSFAFGPDPKLSAQEQHSPPANQKGAARRPTDNVFGTWVLFSLPDVTSLVPQCKKLAPGTPANLPDPYVRVEPPPTLPPDPGWTEGSRA